MLSAHGNVLSSLGDVPTKRKLDALDQIIDVLKSIDCLSIQSSKNKSNFKDEEMSRRKRRNMTCRCITTLNPAFIVVAIFRLVKQIGGLQSRGLQSSLGTYQYSCMENK